MAFCKFFILSLNGFNSLTWPSIISFCISVTGLKSVESLCCVFKSPTRSDEQFCWMFGLVLRNSLTIKSPFLGSVIFRNDMCLLPIFLFVEHAFKHGFEHCFEHGFEHGFEQDFERDFEHGLNMILSIVLNMILNTILNVILNIN